jgi:hypothetical protein
MAERVEIKGGADPFVTAAVMAVIAQLEADEARRWRAPRPRRPSAWVRALSVTDSEGPRDDVYPDPSRPED